MKRKIYLELIITLVVGFLIGFFTNSIITDRRIKDYSLHKGESEFWRRALSEVHVTKAQKEAIFPIIKEHSLEARSILMESWKEMIPIWEEMEQKILLELTPEQQEHIKTIQSERKKRFRQGEDKPQRQHMQEGQGKHRYQNQKGKQHQQRKGPMDEAQR